jgi:hypothetical protein
MIKTASDVIVASGELKKIWGKRDVRIKEYYRQIQMEDEFAQEGLESFVGNDPRSAYNLVVHMLNQKIPHRIKAEELDKTIMVASTQVEGFFTTAWNDIYEGYRRRGKQSFMRDLIGLLIATGWYSVFSTITADGQKCMAEIWNPSTVYPYFDDDLVECAHMDTLSESSAKRMLIRNNWKADVRGSQKLFDYWWLDTPRTDGGWNVWNSVVIGTTLVKAPTLETRMRRIPIFVSPTGGLPDTGYLSDNWAEEVGQPSIATNSKLYRYWNKWWTFQMQILRDTAQPKILEKSRSTNPIVKLADLMKRGVVWRGAPEDSVEYVTPPPIPLELRGALLDMEAMKDRGGPSAAMFGAVAQQMTSFMMSQVSSLTAMMASAYHEGLINCLTDIDNFWVQQMKDNSHSPYGFKWPKEIPETYKITAEYEVRVPGDMSNRATVARMLNPNFRLPIIRVYDEVFPEVKNPIKEIAQVRAEDAEANPVYAQIALIQALREQAKILTIYKDSDGAALFTKAADMVESTLTPQQEQQLQQQPTQQPMV